VRSLSQLVPPTRLARWAAPGAVAVLVLLGALQAEHRRNPWVVVCAVLVAVGAARLMAPDRPVLSPVAAVLSAGAVAQLGNGSASNVGWFAVCILVARLGFISSTRVTVGFWAAGVLAFGLEWLLTTADRGWAAWIAGTTFTAFACLLARRERDLAQRLRIAQAGLADRVRSEERNRIARELHDVIAHSLTVSLLHVSSARLALAEDPTEAERALAEAERLGRECLTEVRQVVGLLRHDEVGAAAPLPGAAQLAALVEQFRGAGADVVFTVDGAAGELGATVGLTLYRLLQEALTNAARHAPGAPVRVTLSVTPHATVLTVDSAGSPGTGRGAGLVSMRERAELLGGTCTAGPAAGGWRVRAGIPLRTASRPAVSP
jgi:signal transduction histidine kinase